MSDERNLLRGKPHRKAAYAFLLVICLSAGALDAIVFACDSYCAKLSYECVDGENWNGVDDNGFSYYPFRPYGNILADESAGVVQPTAAFSVSQYSTGVNPYCSENGLDQEGYLTSDLGETFVATFQVFFTCAGTGNISRIERTGAPLVASSTR